MSNQPAVDSIENEEVSPVPPIQITISKMFWWMTLAGLAVGAISAFPEMLTETDQFHLKTPKVVLVIVAWTVFLVHHFRLRSYGAVCIQIIPLALLLLISALLSGPATGPFTLICMSMNCTLIIAILFGLEFSVSRTVNESATPQQYLLYRLGGGVLIFGGFFGFFGFFIRGGLDITSILMGSSIGAWAGFYQAMATSKWLVGRRILGVGTRLISTVGLLGALFSPWGLWWCNANLQGFTYIPMWLCIFVPIVAVLIVIALVRLFGLLAQGLRGGQISEQAES